MSKAQQRWDNCVAAGRKAGLNGDRPDCNPYIHPRGRSAWYKGHEQGSVERRKRAATSNRNMKVANLFSRVPENILIRLDADSPFVQRIRKENLDQYRASQQSDSSKED